VYTCVVDTLACPSSSWIARRSAPPSRRWVANECRSACGCTVPPGFTARFSDPSACGRSLCSRMDVKDCLSLAATAFQPVTGHSNQPSDQLNTLPEPGSRYGLSLAHNDAFATIARSMFLACTFVPVPEKFADPFDSRLFRSVRFRGRSGAISTPGTRFPRQFPSLPNLSRSPLPIGSSLGKPSGSKRSTGSNFRRLISPNVRLSQFRLPDFQTRFVQFDYRATLPLDSGHWVLPSSAHELVISSGAFLFKFVA